MIQISKILKKVPIFRMLGKESIDFIVERLKFKTFDKNEVVCKVGDPGDSMYIIITGKVDICIYGQEGAEQIVASLEAGDYFGEMALLTGETRSATVRTSDASEMFLLHKDDFDVILEKFPSITLSMGKIVSKRLRETLSKASQLPKAAEVKDSGVSGSLGDQQLVELINFCESNSLTGSLTITKGSDVGVFEYEKGELSSVKMGNKKDDQALDEMLGWTEGEFTIKARPLELKKEDKAKPEAKESKAILIVNNSLVVRKLIERAFKGLGYDVQTAENIAKSQDAIKSSAPDIVITDVKLADGSGLGFCQSVKSEKDIPFIFLADDSLKTEFDDELKSIGNAALTKTHEVSEIVKLVENMI
jgi:CRP-like cAMP-binding protein/CheY-like chemotaxis protein